MWHHGVSSSIDGEEFEVRPLKYIAGKEHPKKGRRTFIRMRLFCKALDSILGVTTSPCVGDLGGLFQTNAALLQGKGVLLPNETDTGQSRKRQRNENSWAYIAQKYEQLELLKKKAAKSNISLDKLQRGEEQKEKER